MSHEPAAERLARLQALTEALAHPARRQILLTIHMRGGEATAGAIANRFAHAWPTTTRHLQVLAGAGLLESRKRGRERLYRIVPAALDPLRDWLAWFETKSIYAKIGDPESSPTHGPDRGEQAEPRPRSRARMRRR